MAWFFHNPSYWSFRAWRRRNGSCNRSSGRSLGHAAVLAVGAGKDDDRAEHSPAICAETAALVLDPPVEGRHIGRPMPSFVRIPALGLAATGHQVSHLRSIFENRR
jgi:hypothetical protein